MRKEKKTEEKKEGGKERSGRRGIIPKKEMRNKEK